MNGLLLGVDIGTSSSKGVLARPDGEVVATAQREHALSLPRPGWAEHQREVERLMITFPLLPINGSVVLEALRGVREHLLSYYDAPENWAVARLGQVVVVLSEDFNPGAVLDGVSFANPLDPALDLAALG